jgi:predicted glycogen debranching enzyme
VNDASTLAFEPSETTLARAEIAHPDAALGREWLVTNGIGGFAAGTVGLANTRRYHGLLIAALRPPVERVLLLSKLGLAAHYQGRRYELDCNEFADGTVAPRGYELLRSFHLAHGLPVWRFALADAVLEQRILMPMGQNTTIVALEMRTGSGPLDLELAPLCTYRGYHSHTRGGWSMDVTPEAHGCRIIAFAGATPVRLHLERAEFILRPEWWWRLRHRLEAERGLDAVEDLFAPGRFAARITPGERIHFVATAEPAAPVAPQGVARRELQRRQALLGSMPSGMSAFERRLALAAEQFIVGRRLGEGEGRTVIAGYPWFTDWGRDTMIALPGLTLPTGRAADAAAILRTFGAHIDRGMLPNRFPDSGEAPEYNTADATLWYFHALAAYLAETRDTALLRELYPTLREVVSWHRRGTRFGIRVDPGDGLLRAGEPGVQLTWMDAKVGAQVITPRAGKPVEINALWHFALRCMGEWASELGDTGPAAQYEETTAQVARAFAKSFWYEQGGYLYDVIDTPDGPPDEHGHAVDSSLRPNQIFAVSLGGGLLSAQQARAVVDVCARELLTPVGLRSLAPGDPRYAMRYCGGPAERDAAYHQGTVWTCLLGPFALAHYRVYGNVRHALELLRGLEPHLDETCLGNISEIADGAPPHTPRGCMAQAWSVAETLRAWHALRRESPAETRLTRKQSQPR